MRMASIWPAQRKTPWDVVFTSDRGWLGTFGEQKIAVQVDRKD
jgi:hypothetical protein